MSNPSVGRPKGLAINRWAFNDLCRLHCVSRAEVARAAALSAGYLSELVSGAKGASPATARRLAEALSCSVQTLFPELTVAAA